VILIGKLDSKAETTGCACAIGVQLDGLWL